MGCMVMGGLIVNYVTAECGIEIVSSTSTYSIQESFLDAVCPKILPLAVTMLVYYLLNKRRWSSNQGNRFDHRNRYCRRSNRNLSISIMIMEERVRKDESNYIKSAKGFFHQRY